MMCGLYNVIIACVGIFLLAIAKDILALLNIRLIWKLLIGGVLFSYVMWLFWGARQGAFFWLNSLVLSVLFVLLLLFFILASWHHSLKYVLTRIARIRWLVKTLMHNKSLAGKNYPTKFTLFLLDIKTELKHLVRSSPLEPRRVTFLGQRFTFASYREYVNLMWEIFVNQAYYLPLQQEPKYIIDGGSNVGMSILFFKTLYPNAKILGFEPNAENFKILSHNVNSNKWANVSVENKAIYNKDGFCTFNNYTSTSGQISESPNSEKSVQIPCVRLSSYINQPVDILKLDIEGVETLVIEELNHAEKFTFIKNMLIEFHYGENKENNSLALILKILEQNNFSYQISGRRVGLFSNTCDHYDVLIYAYKN